MTIFQSDWDQESSHFFLMNLIIAVHCIDKHKQSMRREVTEGGDLLVVLCDENCPAHFEISLREFPEDKDVDLQGHIACMLKCLTDQSCELTIHPNGLRLCTVSTTYTIVNHAIPEPV